MSHRRPTATPRQRGFTLAEVTVSLISGGILMGAIAVSVALTAKALPDDTRHDIALARLHRGLDVMMQEIRFATTIEEATDTLLRVKLPDRTGDAVEETVSYSYASGVLTRTFNGSARVLATNLSGFAFRYTTRAVMLDAEMRYGAEQQVFSTGLSLLGSNHNVDAGKWYGQSFAPALPADTDVWKVTQVMIPLMRNGAEEDEVTVGVYVAGANGQPLGTTLATAKIDSSELPATMSIVTVAFSSAVETDSVNRVAVYVSQSASSSLATTRVKTLAISFQSSMYLETSNAGAGWTTDARTWPLAVYGTPGTEQAPETSTQMLSVYATGTMDQASARMLTRSARLLNTPEAP